MHTSTRSPTAATFENLAGILWYRQPATRWFEALPIGNGRLSGMVYGGTDVERIRLSESTAWSGAPSASDVNPTARQHIPVIRELLFSGQYAEAQRLASEHMLGRPTSFGTNLPLPDIRLNMEADANVSGYRRQLDLDTGFVTIEYVQDGTRFVRETFASNPHGVIAVRLRADQPGSVGFSLSIPGDELPGIRTATSSDVSFSGDAFETLHSNGHQGTAVVIRAHVATVGGVVNARGDVLDISGANEATVFVAAGTNWDGEDPQSRASELISTAVTDGYADVRAAHLKDHGELMRRVSIDLGHAPQRASSLPTDERRERLAGGEPDDELVGLYFQYGRYLTVAGSRKNSPLPLALQGLWNDGLASSASWTNDFHLDMNTQQNYWAAEPTGLGECQEPLFRLIERLADTGRETAQEMYEAPGWVTHTVTNAWGYTAPGRGMGWGINVTGGAWIALQLWEHYEFTGDVGFLRDRAYPVLREAARFFLAYVTPEPQHGWLVSGPSDSPENWYLAPDGSRCSVSMGSTADRVFIEAILRIVAQSAEILGVDSEMRQQITAARALLPPFQIGEHGQLQEWLHDYLEADPAHRHTSHLSALFPERQIGPRTTPDLAQAAEVTIQRRSTAEGWEQTEWVEANFTVYFARLLDGDKALVHLTKLMTDASEANLMTYSAGGVAGAAQNIYSFDGNAGGTAGVAEMLLQSDGTEIELLPALPRQWRTGAVTGLRARGGFEVDVFWEDGHLQSAHIRALKRAGAATVCVRYGDEVIESVVNSGEELLIER